MTNEPSLYDLMEAGGLFPALEKQETQQGAVQNVDMTDGDSGYITDENGNKTKFRASTFNSPETYHEGKEAVVHADGELASGLTQELINQGGRFEADIGHDDVYDRQLRTFRDAQGRDLGLELVSAGLAAPTRDEESQQSQLTGIARRALGLRSTGNDTIENTIQNKSTEEYNPTVDAVYGGGAVDTRRGQGTLSRAFDRGVDETQASLGGFMNYLGEAWGNEELATYGRDMAIKNESEAAFNPRQIEDYSKIKSPVDAATYMLETVGEMAPGLLADGLVTVLSLGTGLGAVAARRTATAVVSRAVRAGTVDEAKGKVMKAALLAGPTISGAAQSAGGMENRLDAEDDGVHTLESSLSGLVGGAMNLAPYAAVFGDIAKAAGLGDDVIESVSKGLTGWGKAKDVAKDAAVTTAKGGGAEGAASLAQMVIDDVIYAQSLNKDWDEVTTNYVDETIRAVIGGASAAGGASGAAHGASAMREYSAAKAAADKELAEQNAASPEEEAAFRELYASQKVDSGADLMSDDPAIADPDGVRAAARAESIIGSDGAYVTPYQLKGMMESGVIKDAEIEKFLVKNKVDMSTVPFKDGKTKEDAELDAMMERGTSMLAAVRGDATQAIADGHLSKAAAEKLATMEPEKALAFANELTDLMLKSSRKDANRPALRKEYLDVFSRNFVKRADIIAEAKPKRDLLQGYTNFTLAKAKKDEVLVGDDGTSEQAMVAATAEEKEAAEREQALFAAKTDEVRALGNATVTQMRHIEANAQDPVTKQAFAKILSDVKIDFSVEGSEKKLAAAEKRYGLTDTGEPLAVRRLALVEAAHERMQAFVDAERKTAAVAKRAELSEVKAPSTAEKTPTKTKPVVIRRNSNTAEPVSTKPRGKTKPAPAADILAAQAKKTADALRVGNVITEANGKYTGMFARELKANKIERTGDFAHDATLLRDVVNSRVVDVKPKESNILPPNETSAVVEAKNRRAELKNQAAEAWAKTTEGSKATKQLGDLNNAVSVIEAAVEKARKKGLDKALGVPIVELESKLAQGKKDIAAIEKGVNETRNSFVSDFMNDEYGSLEDDLVVEQAHEDTLEDDARNGPDAVYTEDRIVSSTELKASMSQRFARARSAVKDIGALLKDSVPQEQLDALQDHLTTPSDLEHKTLGAHITAEIKGEARFDSGLDVLGKEMQSVPTATGNSDSGQRVNGINRAARLNEKALNELKGLLSDAYTAEFHDKAKSYERVESFLRTRGIITDTAIIGRESSDDPKALAQNAVGRSAARRKASDKNPSNEVHGAVPVTFVGDDGSKVVHHVFTDEIVRAGLVARGRGRDALDTVGGAIGRRNVDVFEAFLDGMATMRVAGHTVGKITGDTVIWRDSGRKNSDTRQAKGIAEARAKREALLVKRGKTPEEAKATVDEIPDSQFHVKLESSRHKATAAEESVSAPLTYNQAKGAYNVASNGQRNKLSRTALEAIRESASDELESMDAPKNARAKPTGRRADLIEVMAIVDAELNGNTYASPEAAILVQEYYDRMSATEDKGHIDSGGDDDTSLRSDDFELTELDAEADYVAPYTKVDRTETKIDAPDAEPLPLSEAVAGQQGKFFEDLAKAMNKEAEGKPKEKPVEEPEAVAGAEAEPVKVEQQDRYKRLLAALEKKPESEEREKALALLRGYVADAEMLGDMPPEKLDALRTKYEDLAKEAQEKGNKSEIKNAEEMLFRIKSKNEHHINAGIIKGSTVQSKGLEARALAHLRKEVKPHKVIKGLGKLTHTLRSRLERIHVEVADRIFARTGEDTGKPNFERDARFMREEYQAKWAGAMQGADEATLNAAWKDARTGKPTTEMGKKAHEVITQFTAEISKANPNYKAKGLPLVIDLATLNKDRLGFKALIERSKIKLPKDMIADDLIDLLLDSKGVVEHAVRPEMPHVTGGRGFAELLRPAAKLLEDGGFLVDDAGTTMERFFASGSAYATWSKIFGAKNGKGEFNENALYQYYMAQVPPRHLGEFRKLVAGVTGQHSHNTPAWLNRLNSASFALTAATVLLFSGIASLPEIGVAVARNRGELNGVGKDIIKHLQNTTRRQRDDVAELFGTVSPAIVHEALMSSYDNNMMTMGKVGSAITRTVFKYNGQEFVTRMTRSLATHWGIKFLEQHGRLAKEGDATSTRLLKELRMTHTDVEAFVNERAMNNGNPNLSTDAGKKFATALRLFVDESVSNPHAGQMPLWMSDPRWSIVSSLKKFFYAFWDNYHRSVYGEMKKRKAEGLNAADIMAPLLVSAAVMLPLAAISEFLRELWKYPETFLPMLPASMGRQNERSVGDIALGIAQATGGLGPIQMAATVYEQSSYGRNFAVQAAGPTASLALQIITGEVAMEHPSRILGPINQTPWLSRPLDKTWSEWIKGDEY